MNAVTVVDIRLQLARALDELVSPGSDLPHPGWPWRWPERNAPQGVAQEGGAEEDSFAADSAAGGACAERAPLGGSSFVRDWVEAGQGRARAGAGSTR
jgi:hypothetical protein